MVGICSILQDPVRTPPSSVSPLLRTSGWDRWYLLKAPCSGLSQRPGSVATVHLLLAPGTARRWEQQPCEGSE